MAYENTATRKRPQRFSELLGQDFVTATLTSSVAQGRIAHAYLFAGPRGVGKTSAARILARALNCETGPTAEPCGVCSSCREITAGNSLDVIEIDGASNTSVNDVREIKDEVLFAPNSSRYKVYIIDEVHMLSNSAFNALLKTIEEPPPYIVFIFATTEVHKVPATIRSRCQQFNFRLIPSDGIRASLKAVTDELGVRAEEGALAWIAKESTGSLRDAYTLLDQVISFSEGQVTLERIQEKLGIVGTDEMNHIGKLLVAGQAGPTLEYTADLLDRGIPVEQFVIDLAEYFRNLLFLKSGIRKESLLSFPAESYAEEVLVAFSQHQLEKATELLMDLHRALKLSLNQRFELELLLTRLTRLDTLITPEEVFEQIRRLRKGPVAVEEVAAAPGAMDILDRLVDALKGGKPTLASSIRKVDSFQLDGEMLTLSFQAGDRYSGESVQREKDTVAEHAAQVLGRKVRVGVQFLESAPAAGARDERVDMVTRVFRGTVIQKE